MAIWWNMPCCAFDGFLREKYRCFAIEWRAWWLRPHKPHVHVILMMIQWWVHTSQEGLERHFQHTLGCGGGIEYGISFHHYKKEPKHEWTHPTRNLQNFKSTLPSKKLLHCPFFSQFPYFISFHDFVKFLFIFAKMLFCYITSSSKFHCLDCFWTILPV